jgi:hypothetical protein
MQDKVPHAAAAERRASEHAPERNRRCNHDDCPVRYAPRLKLRVGRGRFVDVADMRQAGEAPTAREHLGEIGRGGSKPPAQVFIVCPLKPGDVDAVAHGHAVKSVASDAADPPFGCIMPTYPQYNGCNQKQQRQHRYGVKQDVEEASHRTGIVSYAGSRERYHVRRRGWGFSLVVIRW